MEAHGRALVEVVGEAVPVGVQAGAPVEGLDVVFVAGAVSVGVGVLVVAGAVVVGVQPLAAVIRCPVVVVVDPVAVPVVVEIVAGAVAVEVLDVVGGHWVRAAIRLVGVGVAVVVVVRVYVIADPVELVVVRDARVVQGIGAAGGLRRVPVSVVVVVVVKSQAVSRGDFVHHADFEHAEVAVIVPLVPNRLVEQLNGVGAVVGRQDHVRREPGLRCLVRRVGYVVCHQVDAGVCGHRAGVRGTGGAG